MERLQETEEATDLPAELPTDLMGRLDFVIFSLFIIFLTTLSCAGLIDLRSEPGTKARVLRLLVLGSVIVMLPKAVLRLCWGIAMPEWARRWHVWIELRTLPIGLILILLGLGGVIGAVI